MSGQRVTTHQARGQKVERQLRILNPGTAHVGLPKRQQPKIETWSPSERMLKVPKWFMFLKLPVCGIKIYKALNENSKRHRVTEEFQGL